MAAAGGSDDGLKEGPPDPMLTVVKSGVELDMNVLESRDTGMANQ